MADLVKVDTLDRKLMELLAEDARRNSDELAKELEISPSTVRRRMQRLIQSGLVRIIGVPDNTRLGHNLNVVIGLHVALDKVSTAIEKLSGFRGVQWVISTTGRYNILTFVRFRSTEELSAYLEKELVTVEGLSYTETFICLDITAGSKRQVML